MERQKLFRRDFTMVVIGQIISLFGNAVVRFALPLYLLQETGSSTLFGLVTACAFIPMVIFSLLGGVIADRVNKRNIMVILDFATALLMGGFCVSLGHAPLVPLVCVSLMLLYGISGAYQPAVQASIPLLVEDGSLMQGNAVINMVSTLANLLGPVAGGILFSSFGVTPLLILSVLCFLASAVMEIFIRIPHEKRMGRQGIFQAAGKDLAESWYFMKEEKPAFLSVVGLLAIFNMVLSASLIVGIPIIIVNVLGMTETYLGITEGAMGLGGLAGGVLSGAAASRLKIKESGRILLICSAAVSLMGCFLTPAVPAYAAYWGITVMTFLIMCLSTVFTVIMITRIQQETPAHLLGKIMASIMALASCAQPVGQAVYGVLFDLCSGMPWAVMLGAGAAACLVALGSRRTFAML